MRYVPVLRSSLVDNKIDDANCPADAVSMTVLDLVMPHTMRYLEGSVHDASFPQLERSI